jgi:hypothetical protein
MLHRSAVMMVERVFAEVDPGPGNSAFHNCSTCVKEEEVIPKEFQNS